MVAILKPGLNAFWPRMKGYFSTSAKTLAPQFLNKKINSSMYSFLSAHLLLSACLPPPAVRRPRATTSEAQRSAPARPLWHAAAAIPHGASIPRHTKAVLCRAQGVLAQATEQVLTRSRRCSPRLQSRSLPRGTPGSSMRHGGVELRDSSKQQR
jgi:hypothetical protein